MDKLDQTISETKAELAAAIEQIAALERLKDILQARLEAYTLAANLRPINAGAVRNELAAAGARKGRQPGAISTEWRNVLHTIFLIGEQNYNQIKDFAVISGIKTDLANTRERVRSFVRNGLMEATAGGFVVTDAAARRFGFITDEEIPRTLQEAVFGRTVP